jgi:copper(I)-binding protein
MKNIAFASLILLSASSAFAQVVVKDPWVRATVPQQKATGAFMQLTSPEEVRLVDAYSPIANSVEIHEMKMENNVMKMRPVERLVLPAAKTVELKPGGLHIMLMGLKQQLNEGDSAPVTLVVEGKDRTRQSIELEIPVRPLNSTAGNSHRKH